jgi:hypothetical protein
VLGALSPRAKVKFICLSSLPKIPHPQTLADQVLDYYQDIYLLVNVTVKPPIASFTNSNQLIFIKKTWLKPLLIQKAESFPIPAAASKLLSLKSGCNLRVGSNYRVY